MTYTPKPGDRVTSPLLVGEWEVQGIDRPDARLSRDGATVYAPLVALVLVAPPLPPEPAVGSVVRAHGRLWMRWEAYWTSPGARPREWSYLATAPDLSPVVAVDDVAEWMPKWTSNPDLVPVFRRAFGGWDK